MKIANLMLGKGWGGIQTHFIDCCLGFASYDHQIMTIINSEFDCQLLTQLTSGQKDIQIKTTKVRLGNYDQLAVWNVARILREFKPDVVVAFGQRASLFAGRVKKLTNCDWSLFAPTNGTKNGYYFQFVDVLIPATSEQSNPNYYDRLPSRTRFSEKIPHFSTITPVEQIDSSRAITNIFSAGRLEVPKGYAFLIQAMHKLSQQYSNIQLHIAGDGSEYQNLLHLRDQLHLTDSIHFLGRRVDVHKLVKECDLFVLPSLSESFGIVLLEAMAVGIPIVATRTEGPLEILTEQTSILVNKGNSEALKLAIEKVILYPDDAYVRARNALRVYKSNYSTEVVVPQLLALFERFVNDSGTNVKVRS